MTTKDLPSFPEGIDPKKLDKALSAWARWYSARLDRIKGQLARGDKNHEDYSGYEQDLFEALGCHVPDE